MRGEARLRGLRRIISSKTISPRLNPRPPACGGRGAKPACAGYSGIMTQRPYSWRAEAVRVPAPPEGAGVSSACWDRGRLVRIGSAGISPLTPREGGTSSPYRGRFFGGACVPALVLGFRTPNLPLLLLWEQGVGGMRGKSARECSKLRIAPKNAPLEQRRTGTLFRPLKKPCSRC